MKKVLVFVFCIVAIVAMFSFTASAATEYTSGYYTYTVTDGKATITDVDEDISGDVVIPSALGGYPVTSIGDRAFSFCSSLSSIDIPSCVTSIGSGVFWYCENLRSVNIPSNITSIGDETFEGCSSLNSIDIPDSVTSIGDWAFTWCDTLTSIDIPSSVTYIGYEAFCGCDNLYDVYFENTENWKVYNIWSEETITIFSQDLTDSETAAEYLTANYIECYWSNGDDFYYTYEVIDGKATITDVDTSISGGVTIPSTLGGYPVTSIGDCAFYSRTNLESITIPSSVTSIGDGAFFGCESLTSIVIPNSVTYIGYWTFQNCRNLTSIVIPSSVTSIGDGAFFGCESLTSINIPNSVTSIGYGAFEYCTGLKSVTIGNGVTSIDEYAFDGCTGLTSIDIPNSVTSIGYGAFEYCTGLKSVTVDKNNPVYHSNGNCLIKTESKTLILGCKNSVIPSDGSVTSIGDGAFSDCENLTSINIPDGVTSIGEYAFDGCTGLTSIDIPNSVTSIGYSAFSGCSNLESMTIPFVGDSRKTASDTYQYPFGYIFGEYNYTGGVATVQVYCGGSTSSTDYSTYYIPAKLKSVTVTGDISSYAFNNCGNLTSIVIPDSVTSIGDFTFYWCDSLTSVTIGNGVTSIGEYAFVGCFNLKSITIPDGVTFIGDSAFLHCENLKSIDIPDSVTSIGEGAFSCCTDLTSITIPDSVTSIGVIAFNGCTGLTSITIPDSVTSIGVGAFYNTAYYNNDANWENGVLYIGNHLIEAKTTISGAYQIKEGTKTIADSAFRYCESLTSITIPSSVTSIGTGAFFDCTGLTSITVAKGNPVYHSTGNNVAEHSFGNDCDTTCNGCDYAREITHDYSDAWTNNDEEHWHECTICGDKIDIAEHNEENGACTGCGKKFFAAGDVDGEEGITANDAIYLLYNVFFGDEAYPVDQPCDFDGDNSVTANDAIYLLYHVFFGDESYPLI